MLINIAKIEHISSIDYPGRSAAVVFFNGCEFRCNHCHNKQTWNGKNMVPIQKIKDEISSCIPFISAVVFSGGEPTEQIDELIELCLFAKQNGLMVGIETNGYYPERLRKLINVVDKIFLDIKAPINNNTAYYHATHRMFAARRIKQTLKLDLPIEIRIVDTGNTKEIIKSIGSKFKISILPLIKKG